MRWLAAVVCLGLVWSSFADPADPENILLEGYTFIRPATWKWEAPKGRSIALNRFVIRSEDGKIRTDIGFFYVSATEDMKARVLLNFASGATFNESTLKVGSTNLTYLRARGTVTIRKHGPLPDHELLGTVLPSKQSDKLFFVRILGPRLEVRAAEADFKKMIRQAVEDAE